MPARVLVVDDTPLNVKLLVAKLTAEYYLVESAVDGPSALAAVKTFQPDIVLLDIMMPGMDGFEVCRRLKADRASQHIPIVMVTALSDQADRIRGLDAGADDFLTKPVDDIALFARVRSLIRIKTMSDELRLRRETESQLGALAEAEEIADDLPRPVVLLVEDSTFDALAAKKALAGEIDVIEAGDADVALKLAGEPSTAIDLAIVSLELNGGEGLRVASGLRALDRTRRTPILALAEPEGRSIVAKSLELGVTDYLLKPIDSSELLVRARTQIKRKRFQDRLHASYHRTVAMAATDELTGLFNRRYMMSHLENVLRRSIGSGRPVSLMMIDLDHFKEINDTRGHQTGDKVLTEIARRIGQSVRGVDLSARYGGEEFIVVMPDTDGAGAAVVAERVRHAVGDQPIKVDGLALSISVSIGIASGEPASGAEALIRRADQALYDAKKAGRNRVIAAG